MVMLLNHGKTSIITFYNFILGFLLNPKGLHLLLFFSILFSIFFLPSFVFISRWWACFGVTLGGG